MGIDLLTLKKARQSIEGSIKGWISRSVSVTDYGAGGGKDSTLAFQEAIDAVSGGGIVYVPQQAQPYIVSDTVLLGSNVALIGLGKPEIRLAPNTQATILAARNVSNVTVENLILDGNLDNQELVYNGNIDGLQFYNVDGVIVRNVTVQNYVNVSIRFRACTNIYCENVTANKSLVDGWGFEDCDGGVLVNVAAKNIPEEVLTVGDANGFEIEDGSRNLQFFGVRTENCLNTAGIHIRSHSGRPPVDGIDIVGLQSFGDNAGLMIGNQATNIRVSNANISSSRRGFIVRAQATNIRVSNANISTILQAFIVQANVGRIDLRDCRFTSSENAPMFLGSGNTAEMISFTGCKFDSVDRRTLVAMGNIRFIGCTFSTEEQIPQLIVVSGVNNVSFHNCWFTGPPTTRGLDVITSSQVSIQGCTFKDVSKAIHWDGEIADVSLVGNRQMNVSEPYADPINGTNIVKSGNVPEL